MGLTTAHLIQSKLHGANVTVIADKFNVDTTSAVAAGIFRPGLSFKGPNTNITKRWIDDSWYYWQDLLKNDAINAGVMSLSSYIFSKDNHHVTKNHLIENLVPIYRAVDDNELKICGGNFKYGSFFSTVLIDCNIHLPYVEAGFLKNGGTIVNKRIDNLDSLGYDLVFNCTGLGAKVLCNDHDLVPLRGQVIKVRAPWLKTAFYGDYDTYVIPGFNGVATLGGVRQYDSYNTNICRHDGQAIWERCVELVPGLKKAEILSHKVGLRPHRVPVRVEKGDGRVIHCYGHGGYGVTCAPGTAMYAVNIGLDVLRSNIRSKI